MKERKTVWNRFQYRECDALAAYLERMAQNGWHLESLGLYMTFRKGKPKKIRYEVEVFRKASEYDVIPAPDTEEFADYCEAAGWEFVCAYAKFCVFRTADPGVVPIMTDERQRFEEIASIEKKDKIKTFFVFVFFIAFFAFWNFFEPKLFFSDELLILESIVVIVTCFHLFSLCEVFFWMKTCRHKLGMNDPIAYGRKPIFMRILESSLIIFILAGLTFSAIHEKDYFIFIRFAFLLILTYAIRLVSIWLKLSRTSAYAFFGITYFIFYFTFNMLASIYMPAGHAKTLNSAEAELPLHIYDFTREASDKQLENVLINTVDHSVLGCNTECWLVIDYDDGNSLLLMYNITESEHPWILNQFWKKETKLYHYSNSNDTEKEIWNAISAIADTDEGTPHYIIRYPKRILDITFTKKLTPDAIERVKSLGLHD